MDATPWTSAIIAAVIAVLACSTLCKPAVACAIKTWLLVLSRRRNGICTTRSAKKRTVSIGPSASTLGSGSYPDKTTLTKTTLTMGPF
jgi:hypothetical protein